MLTDGLSDHIKTLAGEGDEPLAVAFSGGGDSTALLALLREHLPHREITALIVDHALRDGSDEEAALAAKRAVELGAKVEILKWENDRPQTGIQEKARFARYGLMGDACRRLGIAKLFLGHSRDDQAETVWMRREKGSGWRGLAGMQTVIEAPIWPELWGVKIIRPLLNETRDGLRAYNQEQGLEYIDDPSNENLRFRRIQARQYFAHDKTLIDKIIVISDEAQERLHFEKRGVRDFVDHHCEVHGWGGMSLNSAAIQSDPDEMAAALRLIVVAVSGQSTFPASQKLDSLVRRMVSGKFKGATIGGVRIIGRDPGFLIVRDKGMVLGRSQKPPIDPVPLLPNTPMIWDGRFLIEAKQGGLTVVPVDMIFDELNKATKLELKSVPAGARPSLPALISGANQIHIPCVDKTKKTNDLYTLSELTTYRLATFLERNKIGENHQRKQRWSP
jgi:tRNA(Ile)-lysidine synthase